ncbi:DUF2163 domain-containing protein [Oceanibium sediminis]|uniref:DUF2163 domain-containing protein n=1 Tax=Oceanibium sediminis TaxID=2026339 RepID=UPI000DD4EA75|nr:DUF2163 domain-containing protein [Oceanibium sediminis]
MSGADKLRARLGEGTTKLARCWRITRKDGRILGFTDHDCPLEFDGLRFEAGAGIDAGALERSTGLSVDNAQALGALTSDRITEGDILAGHYDGAEVVQWLVDWSAPEARIILFKGSLGEVRLSGHAFEAELRGQGEVLNQPLGRAFLKTCDRDLGDAACGVDLGDPAYAVEAELTSAEGQLVLGWRDTADYADGWFTGGALTWLSGANAGLRALVRADQGRGASRKAILWSEARAPVAVGDRVRLVAGCDKHLSTCKAKFANVLNFRGFPHIPGDDWVTAYPRNGSAHDGSVLRWEEFRHER